MRTPQSGSALLIGLILFSLTAAFVLVQLDMLCWYRKAFQGMQVRWENRLELERLLSRLSFRLPAVSKLSCAVANTWHHPDWAFLQLKNPNACVVHKNNQSYAYWVEDLGVQPCLLVVDHDQLWSTHHWRLSAGVVKERFQAIQIQVAIPEKNMRCEPPANWRVIQSGIQSWRTV